MRRSFVALMFLLLGSSLVAQPPSPDDLAKRAIDTQAGKAWEKARYFAFTFDVDRAGTRVASFPQRWDRYTGDYRVSGKDQQREFLVVMNTNTKQGKAWVNGSPALDKDLQEMLALGYRRFINDTYWLLMPVEERFRPWRTAPRRDSNPGPRILTGLAAARSFPFPLPAPARSTSSSNSPTPSKYELTRCSSRH